MFGDVRGAHAADSDASRHVYGRRSHCALAAAVTAAVSTRESVVGPPKEQRRAVPRRRLPAPAPPGAAAADQTPSGAQSTVSCDRCHCRPNAVGGASKNNGRFCRAERRRRPHGELPPQGRGGWRGAVTRCFLEFRV
jgi:hypothetical protein